MRIKLDPGAYMPVRAHDTDAGLDLRTPVRVVVPAAKVLRGNRGERVWAGEAVINTGVHIELPPGYFGKLESKSGLNVKSGIVSLGGVIDEGYTGAIVCKLYNLTGHDYTFEAGDKVVQLIIQPYTAPALEVVENLGETDRGSKGFGSSGK